MNAAMPKVGNVLRSTDTMRALVFHGTNNITLERVPIPKAGIGEAVIRITLTTICGTDVHIPKGEYPVHPGLVIGHEPVGVIHEFGEGVTGYKVGDRVLVGDNSVRPMRRLPQRPLVAVRRVDGRMEVWQHHQRCAGRIPARAARAGKSGEDSG